MNTGADVLSFVFSFVYYFYFGYPLITSLYLLRSTRSLGLSYVFSIFCLSTLGLS